MSSTVHRDKSFPRKYLGLGERIEVVENPEGIRFIKIRGDFPVADSGPYPVNLDEFTAGNIKNAAAEFSCSSWDIAWTHRSWVLGIKDRRLMDLVPILKHQVIERICGNCSRRRRGYCEGTAWNGRELVPYRESVDQDEPACTKFLPSQKIRGRGVEVP